MAEHPKFPEQQVDRSISAHEGANNRVVPWLQGDNQAEFLENLIVTDIGKRVQRDGAQSFGGVFGASEPGGLDWYNVADFSDRLICVVGSNLYNSDGDGAWNRTASGVSLVSNQLHQFVRGRNAGELAIAVCSCEEPTDPSNGLNGHSLLTIWNIESNTDTQVSLAPRALGYFQNRLFYAEEETLGWSEIGQLADASEANRLIIEPGIGGEITAIIPARDLDPKIWIFKENSIALFTPRWGSNSQIPSAGDALDTVNSSVRLLSRGAGCIATRSAVWVPGSEGADVFFLSRDGVRSLQRADNDVQVGAGFPLSYNIPDWINRINFAAAHKAVASVFDNAYHLAVPLDGSRDNSHVLRYDISAKAWTLHTLQGRALTTARLGGTERLWMQNNFPTTDSSTTEPSVPIDQVYRVFSGRIDPSTDATNPVYVTSMEITKAFVMRDPVLRKRWDRFTMAFSSGDTSAVEIAYSRDRGQFNTVTETRLAGSLGTIVLAEDQLPWQPTEDRIRRLTVGLSDIGPSYNLQMRIGGVTGATEAGKMSYYLYQLDGHLLPSNVQNDD